MIKVGIIGAENSHAKSFSVALNSLSSIPDGIILCPVKQQVCPFNTHTPFTNTKSTNNTYFNIYSIYH